MEEVKKVSKWLIVLLILSASLFLFGNGIAEIKSLKYIGQDIDFRSTIVVSGKGEVTAIPDIGQFNFAVINEAKKAEDAQESVSETMNALLLYLEESDIDDKDIKTTNYNISPRYEYISQEGTLPYPNRGKRTLVGYEVSHWVEVKVRDVDALGGIIAQIGSRGATNISSVNFVIDDEEVIKAEARKIAIDDAKDKAKVLAKDLGVRIVKIVSFNESGAPGFYRGFDATLESVGGAVEQIAPEIPVGENKIISNVTIIYGID